MEKIFNYIGGEHVPSQSNEWIENNNSYFSKLTWDYEHKC